MRSLRQTIVPGYLGFALLLGGASAAGFWANLLLQATGFVIIAAALVTEPRVPVPLPGRRLTALLLAAVALVSFQLLPLPPWVWSSLAGRDAVVRGFALLDELLPWIPVTLDPYGSISSVLWLVPAGAAAIAGLRLPLARPWIAWTLVVVTLSSVALGALQLLEGGGSRVYLYDVTNHGAAVGFFANANHMGILLVAAIPFVVALYANAREKGGSVQKAAGLATMLAGVLLVIGIGIALNGSLAALGLSIPAALASGLIVYRRKQIKLPRWLLTGVTVVFVGSAVAMFTFPLGNNLTTEEARSSEESRYTSFARTLQAAGDYMPLGSGIGTFRIVYQTYEDPARVDRTYMNHAHNDYLELLLETGAPGLILVSMFLFWWTRRTVHIWAGDTPDSFAEAATIATAALLVHSFVDYPLRTAALSSLFAVCCVLMAEPRQPTSKRRKARAAIHLGAD